MTYRCNNYDVSLLQTSSSMNRLVLLYERMKKLRESGVRMKDISEETDIASSVLSSLYSSVLPMYVNLLSGGDDPETALDKALQQVNNVSKRKLLGCLDELYEKSATSNRVLFLPRTADVLSWMTSNGKPSSTCPMPESIQDCTWPIVPLLSQTA